MEQYAREKSKKMVILVETLDGLFLYNHKLGRRFEYFRGGRTDRNDSQDIEILALLPRKEFIKLN